MRKSVPCRRLLGAALGLLLPCLGAACDTADSPGTGAVGGNGALAQGNTGGGGGGGATGALPTDNGTFVLSWEDEFHTLDTSLWALQTFSWDGNLAQFATENATVADGMVNINLTAEPSDVEKPYRGVEMRSAKTFTYGKVEARIRFAKGPGVISGLVAIYTPWPADDWNEIDFEHLGKAPTKIQTNCQVYTGPVVEPPVTTSVTPERFEEMVELGFDAEADFHVYTMEWTPVGVKFLVDGVEARSWNQEISRMKLPQNILFTIWASSSAGWAGAVDDTTAPTSAQMDWIRVYDYQ
jgi:endo-1,3-1,4-beta-glycanase ExoK